MASLERALTKSLLSTITEESTLLRRKEILSTPSPARRATVLALHNLAVSQPRLIARMLGVPYTENGWEHIGSGVDSTVFRISTLEVLKVNRRSIESNSSERQEFIARKQEEHRKLKQALGEFVVPHQAMQTGPHPVVPTVEIVEIRQPYKEIVDPKLIHPAVLETVAEKISDMESRDIDIVGQLGEYIERSRHLYMNHGLLPDVCGAANLVLVNEQDLRQIDGLPIGRDDPQIQQSINGYLDMMETAIAIAS